MSELPLSLQSRREVGFCKPFPCKRNLTPLKFYKCSKRRVSFLRQRQINSESRKAGDIILQQRSAKFEANLVH